MRTVDDIKATILRYKRELVEEQKRSNGHYVVVGGNMCITQPGSSWHYVLGKGDPVPMLLETAKRHLKKNESKLMDDIRLEVIKYSDWLENSIKECEKLLAYTTPVTLEEPEPVQTPTTETPMETPMEESKPEPQIITMEEPATTIRPITINCPTCPMEFGNCALCKLCAEVNTESIPWEVKCEANNKNQ